jgi:hypothetical protein
MKKISNLFYANPVILPVNKFDAIMTVTKYAYM